MIENQQESVSCGARARRHHGLLAGCASQPDAIQRKTGWMRAEVADSYVHAYPLVLMDVAKEAATGGDGAQPAAPLNTLRHAQAHRPSARSIRRCRASTARLDRLARRRDRTRDRHVARYARPLLGCARTRHVDERAVVVVERGRTRTRRRAIANDCLRREGLADTLPKGASGSTCRRPMRGSKSGCRRAAGATDEREETAARDPRGAAVRHGRGARRSRCMRAARRPKAVGGGTRRPSRSGRTRSERRSSRASRRWDNPAPADDARELLGDIGVSAGYPDAVDGRPPRAATAGVAEPARLDPASNLLNANGWSWIGDTAGKYGRTHAARVRGLHAVRHRDARRQRSRSSASTATGIR